MNIIQQRERIKFLIDHIQTTRFDDEHYQAAITIATEQYINDRYDNIKLRKEYSFESVQRLRDELYTLIVEPATISITGNILPYTNPMYDDYRHLLLVKVNMNSTGTKEYTAIPTTYDEYKSIITIDPFTKPKTSNLYNIYYIETGNNIKFFTESGDSVTNAMITYLKYSVPVSFGTYRNAGYTFTVVTDVIVSGFNTVIGGVTYAIGQELTLPVGSVITSGQVIEGFTNSDLPIITHEEICKMAGKILLGTADDYNKSKFLEKEVNLS